MWTPAMWKMLFIFFSFWLIKQMFSETTMYYTLGIQYSNDGHGNSRKVRIQCENETLKEANCNIKHKCDNWEIWEHQGTHSGEN